MTAPALRAHDTPHFPESTPAPTAPPVEDERGPQNPVREPGPVHEPERVE